MQEPLWVTEARKYIGLQEIVGPKHSPTILEMWDKIKRGGINDDETPWCAAFVGFVFESTGIQSTRFESAKSYLEWGQETMAPLLGSVAVFGRTGGGHVGFVVGVLKNGDLIVLGGNQSNRVSLASFNRQRVISFRWPAGIPLGEAPPVMDSVVEASKSEA